MLAVRGEGISKALRRLFAERSLPLTDNRPCCCRGDWCHVVSRDVTSTTPLACFFYVQAKSELGMITEHKHSFRRGGSPSFAEVHRSQGASEHCPLQDEQGQSVAGQVSLNAESMQVCFDGRSELCWRVVWRLESRWGFREGLWLVAGRRPNSCLGKFDLVLCHWSLDGLLDGKQQLS